MFCVPTRPGLRVRKRCLTPKDPHAAWNGLIANPEIHEIPGDLFDILVQPHVNRLAEYLKSVDEAVLTSNLPKSAYTLHKSLPLLADKQPERDTFC